MTNTSVSDTLNRAADLIERRGWGQGPSTWGDSAARSRLCVEGAIAAVSGVSMLDLEDIGEGVTPHRNELEACPAYKAMVDYLQWKQPFLFTWNDKAGRTKEEVIEVLRAAAVIEAAKESKTTEVEA